MPVVCIFVFSLIGLFTSMTFPNEDEFIPGLIKNDVLYEYGTTAIAIQVKNKEIQNTESQNTKENNSNSDESILTISNLSE